MLQTLQASLFAAIFLVLLFIVKVAGEQKRGHRQEQKNITGWRLGATGDVVERSGGGRKK